MQSTVNHSRSICSKSFFNTTPSFWGLPKTEKSRNEISIMGNGENSQILDSVRAVNSSRQCIPVSLNTNNNGKTVAALGENDFQINSLTGI